jgi:hypothetical protein
MQRSVNDFLALPPTGDEPFPTDPTSAYLRYNRSLQLIMLDFQYIEEFLRGCLANAYVLIRKRMAGTLTFNIPYKSLENDALGKLIEKFAQISTDQSLLAKLREVRPFRNQCMHRGLLLTSEQQRDVSFLASETGLIQQKVLLTRPCLHGLQAEWTRLAEALEREQGTA